MGLGGLKPAESKKLFFTSAEQAILRNVEALEFDLKSETDPQRCEELVDQINDLKSDIAKVGVDSSFLEREQLRKRISELEEENNFLKTHLKNNSSAEFTKNFPEDLEKANAKFKLYELLLNKYTDIINEFEKKTVGEIKGLVNPDDLSVQSIIVDFKNENYSFRKDFLVAAKNAFLFLSNEISFVKAGLDVNFWLSPREMLSKKVGDDEDLAVFLCSILSALGDKQAEVTIAELENMSTHAFVITDFDGSFFLLDPSQKHEFEKFCGEKAKVLAKYSFNNSKIKRFLYRFNKDKYEQFF